MWLRYFTVAVWLVLVIIPSSVSAQEALVTGTVVDSTNRAPIPNATVRTGDSFNGTATDAKGQYQIAVSDTTSRLIVQSLGYSTVRRVVRAQPGDTVRVDVALSPEVYQLGTVTVQAEEASAAPTTYRLSAASLKNSPALGEPDVVRTAAMLPGVTQPNDLKSAINVRGGAGDQNQFLIDGIEVYNPNHLFGVLGPFNVQALEDVTVHAAQFPAQYGGRLSSVISMQTRRPPDTTFARANLSLASASAVGARQFGGTGVTLAARRTYADPVLAAVGTSFWYNFYDANLKITQDIGKGVSVEGIGFLSRDAVTPRSSDSLGTPGTTIIWGGRMGALRLKHELGGFQHRLTGSIMRTYVDASVEKSPDAYYDNDFERLAGSYDGTLTLDRTRLRFGGELEDLTAEYGWAEATDLQVEEVVYAEAPPRFQENERERIFAGYASAERALGESWTVRGGLRFSGAEEVQNGQFAPRLQVDYDVTDDLTLSASTGRYLQYVAKGEEGAERTVDEPTFLFRKPQQAWTTTLGGTWTPVPGIQIGTEAYFRQFDDVVRLVESFVDPYPNFRRVDGRALGADVFVQKREGWLTGQLSYSYTNTRLSLNKTTYPPDWSVPHSVNGLVGIWLGDYWQFRVAGIWRSGLAFTPAKGEFRAPVFAAEQIRGRYIEAGRNSARFPDYLRFDVSLRRTYQSQWFDWTLYIQALNVLNRTNPLRVDDPRLLYSSDTSGLPPGVESSLPVVPSIGVEFQF